MRSLGPVFRIRRLASAAKRALRNAKFPCRVVQPLVRAWQVMGDKSRLPAGDFVDALRRYAVELLREVFSPVRTADERLLEIDRVVHDADDGEDVAVPHDVLGDRGA